MTDRAEAIRRVAASLPAVDREFCERVWRTDPAVYSARLEALALSGVEHVLDAGCGYGQWSACLATRNRRVTAIDVSGRRIEIVERMLATLGIENVDAREAKIESTGLADGAVDAAFSYGVMMYTDFAAALAELHRVVRPGGFLYFTLTDLGWYLRNIADPTNATPSYDPRVVSARIIANSIAAYGEGRRDPDEAVVIPHGLLRQMLDRAGFEDVQIAAEGTLRLAAAPDARSFYPLEYLGLPYVIEVAARRR